MVQLTDTGYEEAKGCIRRHRLAEMLLTDILQSPPEYVHSSGCKFEHGLQRELEEKVCTMLGHPSVCPHGKPIPSGRCCRRLEKETGQLLAPLTEIKAGRCGTIAYLRSPENADMRKLMAIGALPGTFVILQQRFPSYHVQVGHSLFAIDAELARQIYVHKQRDYI